ncbi:MAG: hypothetical protein DWG76_06820 [Chloroflexi bacterium]|nr:hypothetical protein [Chloroflexota bacterium]
MAQFNKGTFRESVEYRAVPREWYRKLHILSARWPYWSGQRVLFDLFIRGVENRTKYEDKIIVSPYFPDIVEPGLSFPVTDKWKKHPIEGYAASGNYVQEYRFGRRSEYDSALLVSARGNDSDAVAFVVIGLVIGRLDDIIKAISILISRFI